MSANFSAIPALLAAAAMAATPVEAAAATAAHAPSATAASGEALSYHRYYRYRRGPSAGDVLATVLVVGGIAAAVKAASRSRDERYRDRPYPDAPRDGRPYDGYDDMRGIDRAVDRCVAEIERDARVESVDRVERTGEGWQIAGALTGGKPFTCTLGADGRISAIDYEGYAPRARSDDDDDGREHYRGAGYGGEDERGGYGDDRRDDDDRQYDEERYAREWSERDADGDAAGDSTDPAEAPTGDEPQAEYPGGPIPGEEPAEGPVV